MKIEITMPERYKNYVIVGVAILKWWRLRHNLFQVRQRTEANRTETRDVPDKTTAQLDALQMCRYWLDTYRSELAHFLKIVANGELKTAVLSA
jgi:hypothetical protein